MQVRLKVKVFLFLLVRKNQIRIFQQVSIGQVDLIDNKLMLLMKLVIRMRKIKREIKIRQMKMNQFPYRLPNHFQRLRLMHYLKVKTS